jgi:integrase
MPTVKLTRAFMAHATCEPGRDRTVYRDETLAGYGLEITAKSGHKALFVESRVGRGRGATKRQITLKTLDPDEGRHQAKVLLGQMAQGRDPLQERRDEAAKVTGTLKAVCEDYLKREGGMVRDDDGSVTFSGKLRSAPQRLAVFERVIYPDKTAGRQIGEVKRSEIVKLLDRVEDERGSQAAHQVLAFLSKLFSWYASRNDDFRSPIVRGMGRVKPRERAGKRVLTDEEIRDLWAALDAGAEDIPECFVRLVRMLLLTAVRRTEGARMAWSEIEGDVWTVPASRMKDKLDHAVPLTPGVLNNIGERQKGAKSRPFVFSTTDGDRPFSGYSKAKAALDKEIATLRKNEGREPMPAWQLSRDVRRTAKTLMARAGVRPDISERVLAHVIPGVEGIYDRYEYVAEKKDALERLASLIGRILHPADNVAPLDERRTAAS